MKKLLIGIFFLFTGLRAAHVPNVHNLIDLSAEAKVQRAWFSIRNEEALAKFVAEYGDEKVTELLNQKSTDGLTLLHKIVKEFFFNKALVARLLTRNPRASLNIPDPDGYNVQELLRRKMGVNWLNQIAQEIGQQDIDLANPIAPQVQQRQPAQLELDAMFSIKTVADLNAFMENHPDEDWEDEEVWNVVINAQDEQGNTLLHKLAAANKSPDEETVLLFDKLLRVGVHDLGIENDEEISVRKLMYEKGSQRKKMADIARNIALSKQNRHFEVRFPQQVDQPAPDVVQNAAQNNDKNENWFSKNAKWIAVGTVGAVVFGYFAKQRNAAKPQQTTAKPAHE